MERIITEEMEKVVTARLENANKWLGSIKNQVADIEFMQKNNPDKDTTDAIREIKFALAELNAVAEDIGKTIGLE